MSSLAPEPGLHNLVALLHPAPLACVATAILAVGAAARRGVALDRVPISPNRPDAARVTITTRDAYFLPVFASLFLLSIFFLFKYIMLLFIILLLFSSVTAVSFALAPLTRSVTRRLALPRSFLPSRPDDLLDLTTVDIVPGILVVIAWLSTGNFILHDAIGVSLVFLFVSVIKVPSFRVATVLLGGLFFYDVFWVFLSGHFFGKSVMVDVAKKGAPNPLNELERLLGFSHPSAPPELRLPAVLLFPHGWPRRGEDTPYMMLGLGDIALPGTLVTMCLRFDGVASRIKRVGDSLARPLLHWRDLGGFSRGSPFPPGTYYRVALVSYSFGLVAALCAGVVTASPQPALMWIVPSMLGAVAWKARGEGTLPVLWAYGASSSGMMTPPSALDEEAGIMEEDGERANGDNEEMRVHA